MHVCTYACMYVCMYAWVSVSVYMYKAIENWTEGYKQEILPQLNDLSPTPR